MTFYWWSHWFWITVLGSILLSINTVQTYPSREISLEYNHNSKTVTKLYQTATTLTWVTPASPGLGAEKTILQNVVTQQTTLDEDEQPSAEQSGDDEPQAATQQDEGVASVGSGDGDFEDLEYKRSAENANNTHVEDEAAGKQSSEAAANSEESTPVEVEAAAGETPTVDGDEVNNYTNFSSSVGQNATNGNATEPAPKPLVSPAPPPLIRKVDAAAPAKPEWINAIPASVTVSDDSDAAASVSTAVHKVPFTLENANKEEELVRAETEHRSRKSKVLSAEYKHINRFINFSADSKSLLTRSASTAPNEYDNEEGNISSEALAIQRTYFLDAGAISAICFTVFGICCTVGTIGILLYRRRYVNKPQALSEPDSSVYIDDSTMRVSDNSDEMYSLDNDSFLNSLEAMTIQNYWTDTVKHTKL